MTTNRVCPTSHPDTPHYMRQDANGRWYCPIKRAAEREQEYKESLEVAK